MKSINLKFGHEKGISTTPDPLGIVYFLPSAICIAVETALSLVNGKSKEHTFTDYSQIAEVAKDAESGLEKLGILKKDVVGAKFIAYSGGTVPNSYKYSRTGTVIHLERKSSGWHLTNIKTYNLYQKPPHNQFILTEKQDACAIASLRQKYNIEKAST
jgi:hypothetical protein